MDTYNICDTDYDRQWYGCVEIIGTQGYATQAECEENCIEPRPDPTYWRCMQAIGVQGATGSTGVEIDGDNPGMANTYDTEAECLEGCQDWRTEGCWRCSGMPNYAPEFVPGQESNFVDCFDKSFLYLLSNSS